MSYIKILPLITDQTMYFMGLIYALWFCVLWYDRMRHENGKRILGSRICETKYVAYWDIYFVYAKIDLLLFHVTWLMYHFHIKLIVRQILPQMRYIYVCDYSVIGEIKIKKYKQCCRFRIKDYVLHWIWWYFITSKLTFIYICIINVGLLLLLSESEGR